MKRYLLDTNALGDFIDRRQGVDVRVRAARRAGAAVGTSTPALGEFVYGPECSASRDENLRRARVGLSRLKVWVFDRPAAEEYGRLFALLRSRGRLMQPPDVQIAAVALTLGNCTVITVDTDFQAIPGLAVEDWRS